MSRAEIPTQRPDIRHFRRPGLDPASRYLFSDAPKEAGPRVKPGATIVG
jgi:hypothetical protein